PLGKGQVIKPDSNPSPLVSSMLAGLVEGKFHAGPHHDVHTTNCPLAHADSLDPPVPPFASTDIAQYVEQASSGDAGALQRLREAAASGNTLAAYKLGKMYGYGCHDGRGITQDFGQAVHWYTIAANQGHRDSQESLSLMYSNGQSVPQDPATGGRSRSGMRSWPSSERASAPRREMPPPKMISATCTCAVLA